MFKNNKFLAVGLGATLVAGLALGVATEAQAEAGGTGLTRNWPTTEAVNLGPLELSEEELALFHANNISHEELEAITTEWGDRLVAISTAHAEGEDYVQVAADTLDDLYAFDYTQVLFKPTLSATNPFRGTWAEAASYFIGASAGEDTFIEEDGQGFATLGWTDVQFDHETALVQQHGDLVLWMGNIHLENSEGEITTVHKSMGFFRDGAGNLRIALHHSSLPHQG